MKYSDDTDEHRKANIDYVNQRWKQLYGLEMEFSGIIKGQLRISFDERKLEMMKRIFPLSYVHIG